MLVSPTAHTATRTSQSDVTLSDFWNAPPQTYAHLTFEDGLSWRSIENIQDTTSFQPGNSYAQSIFLFLVARTYSGHPAQLHKVYHVVKTQSKPYFGEETIFHTSHALELVYTLVAPPESTPTTTYNTSHQVISSSPPSPINNHIPLGDLVLLTKQRSAPGNAASAPALRSQPNSHDTSAPTTTIKTVTSPPIKTTPKNSVSSTSSLPVSVPANHPTDAPTHFNAIRSTQTSFVPPVTNQLFTLLNPLNPLKRPRYTGSPTILPRIPSLPSAVWILPIATLAVLSTPQNRISLPITQQPTLPQLTLKRRLIPEKEWNTIKSHLPTEFQNERGKSYFELLCSHVCKSIGWPDINCGNKADDVKIEKNLAEMGDTTKIIKEIAGITTKLIASKIYPGDYLLAFFSALVVKLVSINHPLFSKFVMIFSEAFKLRPPDYQTETNFITSTYTVTG